MMSSVPYVTSLGRYVRSSDPNVGSSETYFAYPNHPLQLNMKSMPALVLASVIVWAAPELGIIGLSSPYHFDLTLRASWC